MGTFWNMIFRKSSRRGTIAAAPKEWIAVCLRLSGREYGEDNEREVIREFSRELDSEIRVHNVGTFDGDEYGGGECSLFMYGPNADKLFSTIEPLLRRWDKLKGGHVIKRYGSPDASERIEF
jgi:hypothetical protein